MTLSKEEYLKLLEEVANQEYNDDLEELGPIDEGAWIWADPPAKDKMRIHNSYGTCNAMGLKKDKIQEMLYKYKNIQVGHFLIRIDEYHGYPDKFGKGTDLTMDIEIWERRFKTPSGMPCQMDYRVDLSQDNRFFGRPWLLLFKGSSASKMPVETVVDIVRWMQAIKKMSAFL